MMFSEKMPISHETWLASVFEENLGGAGWDIPRGSEKTRGYLVSMSLSLLVNRSLYSVSL
jgi:hypothetical protein